LLESTTLVQAIFSRNVPISADRLRSAVDRAMQLEETTSPKRRVDPSLCHGGLSAYAKDLGLALPDAQTGVAVASQTTWLPDGPLYNDDPVWRRKRSEQLPGLKHLLLSMFGVRAGAACSGATSCLGDDISNVHFPITVRPTTRLNWGEESDDLAQRLETTEAAALSVAWSPDSSMLAAMNQPAGDLTRLFEWDRAGGLLHRYHHKGDMVTLSPPLIMFLDGSPHVVAAPPIDRWDDHKFRIWSPLSDTIDWSEGEPKPTSYTDGHWQGGDANFSASSDGIVVAVWPSRMGDFEKSGRETIVSVYATREWRFLHAYKIPLGVTSLSWLDAGKRVVVGSDEGQIAIVDLGSAPPSIFQIAAKSKYGVVQIGSVTPSPDGQLIFAVVDATIVSGDLARDPAAQAWMNSTSGPVVLKAADGARLADSTHLTDVRVADGEPIQAAWDPKGRFVAFLSGGRLTLWRPWVQSPSYETILPPDLGTSFSIAPDGAQIAVGTMSGLSLYSVDDAAPQ